MTIKNAHYGATVAVTALVALASAQETGRALKLGQRAELPFPDRVLTLDIAESGLLTLSEALGAPGSRPETGVPPQRLWEGSPPLFDWYGRMSAVLGEGGSHRVALELHGGGSRYLQLWSLAPSPGGGREAAGRADVTVQSVTLENVIPEGATEPLIGIDLASPALFDFGGETYLAGATFATEDAARRVFVAKLTDLMGPHPTATFVTPGADPRVVVIGDEIVLAVRWPDNAQELMGQAPLVILRSKDARTWVKDDLETAHRPRGTQSFELGEARGGLVIASLAHSEPEVEVSHFDEDLGHWAIFDRIAVSRSIDREARNVIWFEGASTAPRPSVLLRDGEGPLRRR